MQLKVHVQQAANWNKQLKQTVKNLTENSQKSTPNNKHTDTNGSMSNI